VDFPDPSIPSKLIKRPPATIPYLLWLEDNYSALGFTASAGGSKGITLS
jgi:hypothetical protein